MIGLDTNILVALAAKEHVFHDRAHAVFDPLFVAGEEYALTPDVLCEFLHAVTDARRVARPLSMSEALNEARALWAARECVRLFATPESVELCFDWMNRFQLGRKRILDTQLAAILHAHGVRRLFTSNPDDFKVFGVFELLVP
jgi:predicted nucleic acid-binding protein